MNRPNDGGPWLLVWKCLGCGLLQHADNWECGSCGAERPDPPDGKLRPEWWIALWDAINCYAQACGGDTSAATVSEERERAVVYIEELISPKRPPLNALVRLEPKTPPEARGWPPAELELPVPGAPGRTVKGHPESVRRYVDQLARQLVARTAWPNDNHEQMTALAELFPCFRPGSGDRLPGISPWSPTELVESLNTLGMANSVRHAALFLLSVWNSSDWSALGLKVRKLRKDEDKTHRRIGRFDIADAWSNWDEHHRGAVVAWLLNPFFP